MKSVITGVPVMHLQSIAIKIQSGFMGVKLALDTCESVKFQFCWKSCCRVPCMGSKVFHLDSP